jgi:hypothetical protein
VIGLGAQGIVLRATERACEGVNELSVSRNIPDKPTRRAKLTRTEGPAADVARAMDSVCLRVVDHCRPYPARPPLLEVHVPRGTTIVALTEQLRRDQLASRPLIPPWEPAESERENIGYLPGCVTLALAPVDEATHGALFRARDATTTVGDLGLESLRGRLSLMPVTLPIVKACPYAPSSEWAVLYVAQRMAALKLTGEASQRFKFFLNTHCLRLLAAQLDVELSDVDVRGNNVFECTVHVVPWGRLARTREGFARYPQAVRERVFTLLLMRNRGVFGTMDRHVCFLIADYVVSLPQPEPVWFATELLLATERAREEAKSFGVREYGKTPDNP